MKMIDTNKLVEGKRYRMTIIDAVDFVDRKPVEILKTYEVEFRGWVPVDEDYSEYFICLWVDGQSRGWDFNAGDVKEFELI